MSVVENPNSTPHDSTKDAGNAADDGSTGTTTNNNNNTGTGTTTGGTTGSNAHHRHRDHREHHHRRDRLQRHHRDHHWRHRHRDHRRNHRRDQHRRLRRITQTKCADRPPACPRTFSQEGFKPMSHHPTRKKLFSKLGQDRQVSETVRLGLLLALSGGLMDAYSYLFRGEVFANAQTGNILLFSVNLSHGNWGMVKEYGCPVLAFGAGIALAFLIRQHFQRRNIRLHWRQIGVLIEIGVLVFVGLPAPDEESAGQQPDLPACGFQVEAFRKIHGNSIATTVHRQLRAGLHAR